jgi:hypothetical protein
LHHPVTLAFYFSCSSDGERLGKLELLMPYISVLDGVHIKIFFDTDWVGEPSMGFHKLENWMEEARLAKKAGDDELSRVMKRRRIVSM